MRLSALLTALLLLAGCGGTRTVPAPDDGTSADMSSDGGDTTGATDPLAYVVIAGSTGDFGVTAVSAETHEIIDRVDTGLFLGQDVAITPDGRFAYVGGVAPLGGGQALVIDTGTNGIVDTIDMGPQGTAVEFIVAARDGAFVYAVHGGDTGSVYKISTATRTVADSVVVGGVTSQPLDVELTPDGRSLYIVDDSQGNGQVTVVATDDLTTAAIETGRHNRPQIAMTPDGSALYVPGGTPENIEVISTATNTITATIPFESFVSIEFVLASADGELVYVLARGPSGAAEAIVISTASNSVVDRSEFDANIESLFEAVIEPSGRFIYYSDSGENAVQVLSTATLALLGAVDVGIRPQFLALTPDGSALYVTNRSSNSVSVVSTATNSLETTIMQVGDGPQRLAMWP